MFRIVPRILWFSANAELKRFPQAVAAIHTKKFNNNSDARNDRKTSSLNNTNKQSVIKLVKPNSGEIKLELSPDMETKLKIIKLELEELRYSGERIPDVVTNEEWFELLKMNSQTRRAKYLRYLWKNERAEEAVKRRKQEKHAKWIAKIETHEAENKDHIQYGLGKNSMFFYIRKSSMVNFYKHRFCQAAKFGQKLVIDLGFEEHMTDRECRNCVDQIKDMYAANKKNLDPFHLHFCNVNPKGSLKKRLLLALPQLKSSSFPIEITEKTYLDLYPREKLVYLTPHCTEELSEFNHDDIYIIGGIVDKADQTPVSLAKAKREKLRMAKFPLDKYLDWGKGSKSLTLDQVMKILLTAKDTEDWIKAFKHVPNRKLVKSSDHIVFKRFSRNSVHKSESFSRE